MMTTSSNKKRPPAVVVGFEHNGLGISRQLHYAGIPSLALAMPRWNPACATSICRVTHASAWNSEAVVADLLAMGERLDAPAPVIISKDETALWLSDARERLAENFILNLPSADTVDLLMDKQRFSRMAVDEGWPIPKTFFVNSADELEAVLDQVAYPSIIKPAVKNIAFRRNCPKKAFVVATAGELADIYRMISQWEAEAVVQEWIGGGDDRVTFCLAYYSASGEPLVLFPGRKLRQWPIECGNTAISERCPEKWVDVVVELTRQVFSRVGFAGFGSVEFKMRPEDDSPVIMEPTVGRTEYQGELAAINGFNMPAIAYHDMLDGSVYPSAPTARPWRLVDSPADRKAAWSYWRDGRLGFGEWLASRRGKEKYMLLRGADMGPFFAHYFHRVKRLARGVLRRCRSIFASNG